MFIWYMYVITLVSSLEDTQRTLTSNSIARPSSSFCVRPSMVNPSSI